MIMRFIKILILILALGASAVLILAAVKPDTFRVERAMTIQAPAEKVFPHINTMQSWGAWSPWEKLDPNMHRTFSGPASGVGARYAWEGNKDSGAGSMEITESILSSRVAMKLDFIKPFEAHNVVEFTLIPKENVTEVAWAMHGPQPFLAKVMSVIFNCDKMVGGQFETGLASLKKVAESQN